ncbi:MAG: PH domain-containing protein [Myxococcota bacterium]
MSEPLARATFDPRVRTYLVLYVATVLCGTFVGVLALPLWIVVGPWWASRYYASMEAYLTERSLVYKHGVWFRQELNIPLDKIQDLALLHGPVLDRLGLATLRLDTAGAAHPGAASANLIGVVDAAAFRTRVIERRDALAAGAEPVRSDGDVLRQMLATLERIEALLARPRG